MIAQSPEEVFGQVKPSVEFLTHFGTGGAGLGNFLSTVIQVIYVLAGIFLVAMLFWGAFDWLTSGGEKDKVESARNKIIHAIIGFVLMAITFAILSVVGQFTGFKFFIGQ